MSGMDAILDLFSRTVNSRVKKYACFLPNDDRSTRYSLAVTSDAAPLIKPELSLCWVMAIFPTVNIPAD